MDESLGPHPKSPVSSTGALIVGAVVIVILLALGYLFFGASKGPSAAPGGARVLFHQGASALWYELDGSALRAVPAPPGFDESSLRVLEAGAALATGETPVLAKSGQYASLGLVRADGSLLPLIDDQTKKVGLALRGDGLVAFSFTTDSSASSSVESWRIATVALYAHAAKAVELGIGYGPRFASDGSVIALGNEGLVRIDPSTGARDVLIDRVALPDVFALSADASRVLISNPITGTLDLFEIKSAKPARVSYVGSVDTLPRAVAFIDPTHFILETSLSAADEYEITPEGITKTASLTISYDQTQ